MRSRHTGPRVIGDPKRVVGVVRRPTCDRQFVPLGGMLNHLECAIEALGEAMANRVSVSLVQRRHAVSEELRHPSVPLPYLAERLLDLSDKVLPELDASIVGRTVI